jgi:5-hydroxyisourate hydrolase-like protein (transthyretin family)
VTGQVLVDGSPAEGVSVTCQDVNGVDKENPTVSGATTDQDGSFAISTYKAGDGVPDGDYVLTFFLAEMNPFTKEFGPDKLNDRYKDPKTSKFKFSMRGAPVEVETIELSTK